MSRSLAEGAADDVEVDAALEALDDGEVDLREVRRQLLGLHDAPRRRLHQRVGLLRAHASRTVSGCVANGYEAHQSVAMTATGRALAQQPPCRGANSIAGPSTVQSRH